MSTTTSTTTSIISPDQQRMYEAQARYDAALEAYNKGSWTEKLFGLTSELKKAKEALDEAQQQAQINSAQSLTGDSGSTIWIIAIVGVVCLAIVVFIIIKKRK